MGLGFVRGGGLELGRQRVGHLFTSLHGEDGCVPLLLFSPSCLVMSLNFVQYCEMPYVSLRWRLVPRFQNRVFEMEDASFFELCCFKTARLFGWLDNRGESILSLNALSASLGCFCGVASSHNDVGALLCAVVCGGVRLA